MGKKIIIRSDDRVSGTTSDNFSINLLQKLEKGTYELVEIDIPYTIYNITANNNKVYINDGVLKTITLTVQDYTASQLATELQTQLLAASVNTATATFNTQTNKITISSGANFMMKMASNTANSAAAAIGFTQDTANATSAVGDQCVNLSNPNQIVVDITGCNSLDSFSTRQSATFIISAYQATSFGDLVNWKRTDGYRQKMNLYEDSMMLQVRLKDGSGNSISLNGSNWALILERVD